MKKSIDRAISLLGTPENYDDYESIKIRPDKGGCCCFHCWPETWAAINERISPFGPLQDEGDVLIEKNNEKFVLECHESGPEIIYYLTLALKPLQLAKSVFEFIVILLKCIGRDKRKTVGSVKIIRRRMIKGKTNEEQIIEINLPLSEAVAKKLMNELRIGE